MKGLLPFGTPWAARLGEPPIFWWEGPDGARVLVRRFNLHYAEGQFILRNHQIVRQTVERKVVPEYETLGDAYPFDAIGLVGVYSDLSADTAAQALRKALHVAEWNGQGWEYPRIWNSSHELFWKEIDRQMSDGASVPVFRGDYGTGWEVWPLTLTREFARWRRLQEQGPLADRLLALAIRVSGRRTPAQARRHAEGWADLIHLADHAWNGSDPANRDLNFRLRREWIGGAEAAFDALVSECLGVLAASAGGGTPAAGAVPGILVFNGLGWDRDGVVALPDDAPAAVADPSTGAALPVQELDGRRWVWVKSVPSVGWVSLRAARSDGERRAAPSGGPACRRSPARSRTGLPCLPGPVFRGDLFHLQQSLDRELVRPSDGRLANQWVYRLEGVDHVATTAEAGTAVAARCSAKWPCGRRGSTCGCPPRSVSTRISNGSTSRTGSRSGRDPTRNPSTSSSPSTSRPPGAGSKRPGRSSPPGKRRRAASSSPDRARRTRRCGTRPTCPTTGSASPCLKPIPGWCSSGGAPRPRIRSRQRRGPRRWWPSCSTTPSTTPR